MIKTSNALLYAIRYPYVWTKSQLQRKHLSLSLAPLFGITQQKNSIPMLDGVRAIACLLVVSFHINLITTNSGFWTSNGLPHRLFNSLMVAGASGVTLFFVLSGFLLFMPFAKSLLFDSTWPSARLFYLRRILRIVPAYYASLFLMILVFHREYLRADHLKELGLFLTFFMDSTWSTYQRINGPFWTLAVEWQFYLLLPLFAIGMSLIVRRGSLRRRIWTLTLCLSTIIAWGLFSRYWGYYFRFHPNKTFLVPRSVLDGISFFLFGVSGKYLEDFAVGMLVCVCYILAKHSPAESRLNRMLHRLSPWLWGAGILMLLFMAIWHYNQWNLHVWAFLDTLFNTYDWLSEVCLAIGFGLCVLAILFGSAALQRLFAWRPLRSIGLISFSMYIWHLPLLVIWRDHIMNHVHIGGWLAYSFYWLAVLLLVIPFSLLFYLCFEKPSMKLGDRLRARRTIQNGTLLENPAVLN